MKNSADLPSSVKAGAELLPSCSTCGAPVTQGQAQCSRCGTTLGKQHTCSFCGVVAKAVVHNEFRFACPACGGPRLPPVGEFAVPEASIEPLSSAKSARSSRALWRVTAGLTGAFALMSLMTLIGVTAVIGFKLLPFLMGLMVVLVCAAFVPLGLIKAAGKTQKIRESIDEAWVHAVAQLARERGSLRASEMAKAFGLSARAVEQMTARVGVYSDISTEVADDGQLVLTATSGKVRAESGGGQGTALEMAGKVRVERPEMRVAPSSETNEQEARLIAELEALESQAVEAEIASADAEARR